MRKEQIGTFHTRQRAGKKIERRNEGDLRPVQLLEISEAPEDDP